MKCTGINAAKAAPTAERGILFLIKTPNPVPIPTAVTIAISQEKRNAEKDEKTKISECLQRLYQITLSRFGNFSFHFEYHFLTCVFAFLSSH